MRLCCQIIALLNRLLWPHADEMIIIRALFFSIRHRASCSAFCIFLVKISIYQKHSFTSGLKSLGFKSVRFHFASLKYSSDAFTHLYPNLYKTPLTLTTWSLTWVWSRSVARRFNPELNSSWSGNHHGEAALDRLPKTKESKCESRLQQEAERTLSGSASGCSRGWVQWAVRWIGAQKQQQLPSGTTIAL